MRIRDFDYIETRLLAPDMTTTEACDRLRQTGHVDLAERLMEAAKVYIDECRAVRREFTNRERRG